MQAMSSLVGDVDITGSVSDSDTRGSVSDSIGDCIRDSLCDSVCDSIRDSTVGSVPLAIVSIVLQVHFVSLCADAHGNILVSYK